MIYQLPYYKMVIAVFRKEARKSYYRMPIDYKMMNVWYWLAPSFGSNLLICSVSDECWTFVRLQLLFNITHTTRRTVMSNEDIENRNTIEKVLEEVITAVTSDYWLLQRYRQGRRGGSGRRRQVVSNSSNQIETIVQGVLQDIIATTDLGRNHQLTNIVINNDVIYEWWSTTSSIYRLQ